MDNTVKKKKKHESKILYIQNKYKNISRVNNQKDITHTGPCLCVQTTYQKEEVRGAQLWRDKYTLADPHPMSDC